jgi:hypothetical protein
VEQVALNRHVSPQLQAAIFMLENRGDVNNKWYAADISTVYDNEMTGPCVK